MIRSPGGALVVGLTWLLTGMLAVVPLWLVVGAAAAVLGALGPFAILAYKPDDGLLARIVLAGVGALPVVAGGIWLGHRWSDLSAGARLLWVAGLSAIWHGPGAALLVIALANMN